MLRTVHAQRGQVRSAGQSLLPDPRRRLLPGGGERVHRGDRGGVVDHPLEAVGQPDQTPQPGQGDLLELGHCRRGAPQHPLRVERRAQELGQDAGAAAADGEVGEEAGVVPVGQAGDDDTLDVGQHRVERFTRLRRGRRQRLADLARPDPGQDRVALDVLQVSGDPLDQLVSSLAELGGVHVAERRRARCAGRLPGIVRRGKADVVGSGA